MERRSLIPLLNAVKKQPCPCPPPQKSSPSGDADAEITAKHWLILVVSSL
jgi:hypothetical protein